jgi:hypothetical protein
MLKYVAGNELWCITQPDHAVVSGYLAAHWGNDAFARPGYYAPFPEPERLRAETVLAIAEHDNGWWEWEADPQIDPADGLPLHLTSLRQSDGFERWRRGIPRFREEHPYVALLISLHAYSLHAPRVGAESNPAFLHPLFGGPGDWPAPEGDELEEARQFVGEQHVLQELLSDRIRNDPQWPAAVEPWHLRPHTRLLQLCDALSLHLCFGGEKKRTLANIPRKNWDDRVSFHVQAAGERRVVVDPYPFDQEPLPVTVRARVLAPGMRPSSDFHAWWHAIPRTDLGFEFLQS